MLRGNSIKLLTGTQYLWNKSSSLTQLYAGNSHPELAQAVAER